MTSHLSKRLGRRLAMTAVLTGAMIGLGASSALASANLSPEGPYDNSKPTAVTVSGTPATGAEFVAIAVCNAEAAPGTRCDGEEATGLESAEAYEEGEVGINVRRGGWPDFDFTSGEPTPVPESETTCLSETLSGEECSVFVSYYRFVGFELQVAGPPDVVPILFK